MRSLVVIGRSQQRTSWRHNGKSSPVANTDSHRMRNTNATKVMRQGLSLLTHWDLQPRDTQFAAFPPTCSKSSPACVSLSIAYFLLARRPPWHAQSLVSEATRRYRSCTTLRVGEIVV